MYHYKINVFWSNKDQAFIGVCPDFNGLAVVGKTREEAFQEAEAALQDYIEIYQEDGIPLPEPTVALEYSGQVRLRMSRRTHQKAAERAELEGVSLNAFLNNAVEAHLGKLEQQTLMGNEIKAFIMQLVTSFTQIRDELQVSNTLETVSSTGLRLSQGSGVGTLKPLRGR